MNPPPPKPIQLPQATAKDSAEGLGFLFIIALMIGVPIWAYNGLDDNGYISHSHTVDLYMKGDWLQNENRECQGMQLHESGKSPEITTLYCPATILDAGGSASIAPHKISIKFLGKVSRPDVTDAQEIFAAKFQWRCVRESNMFDGEHFTCYALS